MRTVLGVGSGIGVFSLPLAHRGVQVTYLDLSPAMLQITRGKAQGLAIIQFVDSNAADPGRFADRSFDLLLNMDGAISF